MDERIGFGLYQSSGDRGSVGHVSVFWLRWCGWCRWVGGFDRGLERWGGIMSGFSVKMAGPGICVLCLADTCTSEVHPVFNPVAPYGYLLSDMYLFMADITNPDFLV